MTVFDRVWRVVLDLLRPDAELSPELQTYCRSEGVDPQSLTSPDPKPRPSLVDAKTIAWSPPCEDEGTCVDSA